MGLVREFHEAFDLPVLDRVTIPDLRRVELRRRLIQEEFQEVDSEFAYILGRGRLHQSTGGASGFTSAIEVYEAIGRLAKELADLRYVGEGCELEFGIPGDAVYREVHRSNMSKLGPDGRPVRRHDGKVLKGPNYTEANVLEAIGLIEGDTSP